MVTKIKVKPRISLPHNFDLDENQDSIRLKLTEFSHKTEDYLNSQVGIYIIYSSKQKLPTFNAGDIIFNFSSNVGFATLQQWDGTKLIPLSVASTSIVGLVNLLTQGTGSGIDPTVFMRSNGANGWVLDHLDLINSGKGSGSDATKYLRSNGLGGWVLDTASGGAAGGALYNGSGPPAAGLGVTGDYYLDNLVSNFYQKITGTWTVIDHFGAPTPATGFTYRISGGGLYYVGPGYNYGVPSATNSFNGVIVDYIDTGIVYNLAAADPTNDRIDLLVFNDNGTVSVITGTPAANPSKPDLDPAHQLEDTFILVLHGSTSPPGVATAIMYAENAGTPTEWAVTTSSGTIVSNSTSSPRTGTYCIQATAAPLNAYIRLVAASSVNWQSYSILQIPIRITSSWGSNKGLTLQFYLAGVKKGNALKITPGQNNFYATDFTDYQVQTFLLASFGIPGGSNIDELRITIYGSTGTIAFRADDIQLTALGSAGGGPAGGVAGMANPMTAVGDIIVGGAVSAGVAAPTNLAIGANNYVLTSNGTTAVWAAAGVVTGGAIPIAVSGTQNGVNLVFTLAAAVTAGVALVFLNGQLLTSTVDYTISGTTLTFISPTIPVAADTISVYGYTGTAYVTTIAGGAGAPPAIIPFL